MTARLPKPLFSVHAIHLSPECDDGFCKCDFLRRPLFFLSSFTLPFLREMGWHDNGQFTAGFRDPLPTGFSSVDRLEPDPSEAVGHCLQPTTLNRCPAQEGIPPCCRVCRLFFFTFGAVGLEYAPKNSKLPLLWHAQTRNRATGLSHLLSRTSAQPRAQVQRVPCLSQTRQTRASSSRPPAETSSPSAA